MAALLLPACAYGQTVTIETTLRDRGFADGIVLSGRASSNIFIALPRGARITNGRLILDGQSSTPTLQRGSFTTEANGQPVDSVGMSTKDGLIPLQRSIALGNDRLNGVDALNIQFKSDLRASADPCSDDNDSANSVTISPATRIAYDVEIGEVRSIADALALLPPRPLVLLPAQPLSPEIATAALQVGVLLTRRGHQPRFDTSRGDDTVALRISPVQSRTPGSAAIQIERNGSRIDIVVDPNSDFTALTRLMRAAPEALAGSLTAVSRAATRTQPVNDRFRAFAALPPTQRIERYGEWRLDFPLLADNGRLTNAAFFKFFIAPDWSNDRPIVTVYLNDQLVAAARPETGASEISVNLPNTLLRFSNVLRVTVERAGGKRYCAAVDQGQAVQILPGSGLVLSDEKGTGFIGVASAFGSEGQVAFPPVTSETGINPYLQLASRILSAFGTEAGRITAVFGSPAPSDRGGLLRFEAVGTGGLILSIADQVEGRDLRFEVNSPLALLSAEPDGRTLLVQLSDPQNPPQPKSLYLGAGSKALIANSGVVWQNRPLTAGPSAVRQAWAVSDGIFSTAGLAIGLVFLTLIGLLLSSRAILKAIFTRRRRSAEK